MTGWVTDAAPPRVSRERLAEIRACGAAIQDLTQRKAPPRPGEWLERHAEAGQSFDQYLRNVRQWPHPTYTTLYIQPIGSFSEEHTRLLQLTATLMERFFQAPVRVLPGLDEQSIPDEAKRIHPVWGDRQLLTTRILKILQKNRPKNAMAVLGLTATDLWPGDGWNFVFGQASLTERVGVWSLYRNGDPKTDFPLCLRRTMKTAVHETGHMLGILHCTANECGMNGSNSLPEADDQPFAFCVECEQKLWLATRADPRKRYDELFQFMREQKLLPEANAFERLLKRLPEKPRESF